ncbi:MAG: hypothetical protein C0596_08995 [Marinilabiliales bacterium]|nr:MAG: hypothetical protein C0596_08995 [Marinilabiliales bacterium]
MSGQLTENFKNNPELKDIIIFDNTSISKGLEYINPILGAIQEQNKIEILYSDESKEFDKKFVLAPTLLKEYKNYWHLIAWNTNLKKYQNFKLEDINDLSVSEDKFDSSLIEECKELYSHIIGINHSSRQPEIIELSFNPKLKNEIKENPLHHSQTVLSESDDDFRILIKVIPNDELMDLILSYISDVEVVNPKWIIEKLRSNRLS